MDCRDVLQDVSIYMKFGRIDYSCYLYVADCSVLCKP